MYTEKWKLQNEPYKGNSHDHLRQNQEIKYRKCQYRICTWTQLVKVTKENQTVKKKRRVRFGCEQLEDYSMPSKFTIKNV